MESALFVLPVIILTAMEKQISLNVNLLKKKATPSIDIFIHWAITGGRFIVILTETIALAAFLYRFTLDRQIVDLHDKIKAKQVIVNAFSEDEVSYRQLQERLLQAKQLSSNLDFTSGLFTKITETGKNSNMTFKAIDINHEVVHVEVFTTNITSLKQFVNQLQELKEINTISIDRIEDRTTSAQIAAVISAHVVFPKQNIIGLTQASNSEGGNR